MTTTPPQHQSDGAPARAHEKITVVSRVTGTFTGEMTMPDGKVVPPTEKAFDLQFAQTVKWDGDLLTEICAFWDSALQAKQIGLAQW